MIILYLLLVTLFCGSSSLTLSKYTAAVYEHTVILPNTAEHPVSVDEALALMNKNLDILEKAVEKAAKQGAHIILTPEDGVYGWIFSKETIYPYLEYIPEPEFNWIPCTNPERFGPTPVQKRLSCMARDNSIYVAANIGDKKPCNTSDAKCPDEGFYSYNTAVVYDSDGKLVARYHKYNLFTGETQFNFPEEPEIVSFETPFGKFGIFICFDILFYYPAVSLVVDQKVDTVLFPTAWSNVLPHLSAIEFHSAWAMGMQVNLLSANLHNTSMSMTGSGIFSPDNLGPFYYNKDTEEGHLLISELNVHPRKSLTKWNRHASTIKNYPSGINIFRGIVFYDNYTFTELKETQGNYTVCQNNLCCHLKYKIAEPFSDEVYVLGAFDDLHLFEGTYYLQVCTLLKCESTDLSSCGNSATVSKTRFESFSLSGNFSTNYVFPEVLLSGVNLAPGMFQVLPDGRLKSRRSISSKALLSATLFGRWYEKDTDLNIK
ncbi:pantetheinase [Bombina bombina]|uniref:pantetheinase n=1 Tax=Bombina bombina TaxID=8345 RepID=UPI00235AABD7|nr:pantetheinase [Bombina bombina]